MAGLRRVNRGGDGCNKGVRARWREKCTRDAEFRVKRDGILGNVGETAKLLRLQGGRATERRQAGPVVRGPIDEGLEAIKESARHRRWIQGRRVHIPGKI